MAHKKALVISIIVIILVFSGLALCSYFSERIPANPEGTIGNTAGNLNNGGYFCESDGTVFFANAYDNGMLYSMNTDQTNVKKISKSVVTYLNHGGNYLYYYQKNSSAASSLGFIIRTSGLYRSTDNGSKVQCLDKSDCSIVKLINNTVYYQKAVKGEKTLQLYRIDTDKKNAGEVATYQLNPASAINGTIYFNGTVADHYLYSLDLQTGEPTLLSEYDIWFPTLCDNYIYFMDTRQNYQLCRYSLSDGSITVLTTDRVDCFNVYGSYVYYQKNDKDAPALMRMGIDGSNPELVATGNFCDINMTSNYVYFRSFGSEVPIYQTPVSGPVNVTTFDAAKEAAVANMDH